MEQRTCNIIMCCKGHCTLPANETGLPKDAIAAYMSKECACPKEDYHGHLMQMILTEALFDYMNSASRPGADLRTLFQHSFIEPEPTLSDRICTMFALVQIQDKDGYVNGFTDELIRQSEKDLSDPTIAQISSHIVGSKTLSRLIGCANNGTTVYSDKNGGAVNCIQYGQTLRVFVHRNKTTGELPDLSKLHDDYPGLALLIETKMLPTGHDILVISLNDDAVMPQPTV